MRNIFSKNVFDEIYLVFMTELANRGEVSKTPVGYFFINLSLFPQALKASSAETFF